MAYKIRHDTKIAPANEAQLLSGIDHFLARLEEHRRSVLLGALVLVAVTGTIAPFRSRARIEPPSIVSRTPSKVPDRVVDTSSSVLCVARSSRLTVRAATRRLPVSAPP